MTNRDFVLKAVKRMRANASFQEILRELDELLLAESIQRSLNQIKRGKGIPAGEVPKLIDGWIRDAKQKKRAHK
ncbi:MAG TPA: hypothetical protein VHY30_00830 [Verrucomicrobiae bacterium]|jgi:hypothetical protein|nr:hypothetical protein [Verrucomicrobiae bacterium]